MNLSKLFFLLFLIGTIMNFVINNILEFIDYKHRTNNKSTIPEKLKDYVTKETVEKSTAYENKYYFVWLFENTISFILTLSLVLTGFYPFVFNLVMNWTNNTFLLIIFFFILISLPETIISIPFRLYKEFKIEKEFGFSTMSLKIWIIDFFKNLLLNSILLIILLPLIILIMENVENWWILISVVIISFSLIISFVYPTLLAPIFNKFIPLENQNLKTKLEKLLEKCNFKAKNIFQMDASKRSKHSNAYFTGFGKNKRIVLYDTLLKQLNEEEIEAVLAHELGHYKHHHITKRMLLIFPITFITFFLMYKIININELYQSFGFSSELFNNANPNIDIAIKFIGFFLLGLIYNGFELFINMISNISSRKQEFQADEFSASLCDGKYLCSALIKLNIENLSELTPPKIYCLFHYSHPPLLERIEQIEKKNK